MTSKKNQPLVSVVIPAYNREGVIAACIKSAIDQGYDNMEIVVVDDKSTDNTVAVIEELAESEPRIRLVRHKKNKGEAGARNTGVMNAKGKYIAYLDSDDFWLPGKLQKQVEFMESAPEHIGGVNTLHYRQYQNKQRSIRGYLPYKSKMNHANILTYGVGFTAGLTLLFRRDLLKKMQPYREDMPLYVDWDWLARFTKLADIALIEEPLAVYDKNPNVRAGEIMKHAADLFLDTHGDDIRALPFINQRKAVCHIYLDVARSYTMNESKIKGLGYYIKALWQYPFLRLGSWATMFDSFTNGKFLQVIEPFVSKRRCSVK